MIIINKYFSIFIIMKEKKKNFKKCGKYKANDTYLYKSLKNQNMY